MALKPLKDLVINKVTQGTGEMWKWGNGGMGKWGNGGMGEWGSGEVGKWGISTKTLKP